AFTRKTPAIVRDLGALPEVVHDSGGGFTYRTGAELRAAIERIAGSPTARAGLNPSGGLEWGLWLRSPIDRLLRTGGRAGAGGGTEKSIRPEPHRDGCPEH